MPDPVVLIHPAAAELPLPRLQTVVANAAAAAHADGERIGYMHGWRVGVLTGGVLGAVLTTLGWVLYLSLAAAHAAPPAAERPVVQIVQR